MPARIQTALHQLEARHHIRILYACESGSRAWGFNSCCPSETPRLA